VVRVKETEVELMFLSESLNSEIVRFLKSRKSQISIEVIRLSEDKFLVRSWLSRE
jgi:hypothetical protein